MAPMRLATHEIQLGFEAVSALLSASALMAFFNARALKLPSGVGLALMGLLASGAVLLLGALDPEALSFARERVDSMDFSAVVFHALLPFLLFAGALRVDPRSLRKRGVAVGLLATLGVAVSTGVFGALIHAVSQALGGDLSWPACLLLGALISPTDPMAVLSVSAQAPISERLKAKICGESLFNDGAALLLFGLILPFALSDASASARLDASALARAGRAGIEALFGLGLGAAIGGAALALMRSISDATAETLISVAAAACAWSLALRLGLSAPLSVVCAGLWIGSSGGSALSLAGRKRHDAFWSLADELLNAVLFSFMGIQALALTASSGLWIVALAAIPCALAARAVSVALALGLEEPREMGRASYKRDLALLSWGGLRGPISIALALSLPRELPEREALISCAYAVCVFSVIVQGLSMPGLCRWLFRAKAAHLLTKAARGGALARPASIESPQAVALGALMRAALDEHERPRRRREPWREELLKSAPETSARERRGHKEFDRREGD